MPLITPQNTHNLKFRVLLDGVPIKHVAEAHTDEGWLVRTVISEAGVCMFDENDNIRTEKLFGNVELRGPDAQTAIKACTIQEAGARGNTRGSPRDEAQATITEALAGLDSPDTVGVLMGAISALPDMAPPDLTWLGNQLCRMAWELER